MFLSEKSKNKVGKLKLPANKKKQLVTMFISALSLSNDEDKCEEIANQLKAWTKTVQLQDHINSYLISLI